MIGAWIVYGTLTSLAIGLAALGLERAFRLHGRQARGVWVAAISISLTLPFIGRLFPGIGLSRLLPAGGETPGTTGGFDLAALMTERSGAGMASAAERLTGLVAALDGVLAAVWIGLAAFLLIRVSASFVRLHRERRSWVPRDVQGTRVLLSERRGPAVLGFRRATVVLPRWALELDREVQKLICMHEEEHLRAGDQRWLLAGMIAAIVVPWNLAVWWQLRRLRLAIEIDCDERVLRRGVPAASYGSLLLQVGARGRSDRIAWAALAEPRSFLERRVRSMIRKPTKHRSLQTVFAVSVALLLVAAACEAPLPVENDAEVTAAVASSTDGVLVEIAEGEAIELPYGTAVIGQLKKRAPGEAEFEAQKLAPADEGYLLRFDGVHLEESDPENPSKAKFEYRYKLKSIDEKDGDRLHEAQELSLELKKMQLAEQADAPTATLDLASPLTFIDGVEVEKAELKRLDKVDIEAVEVIKGEAAVALYGERARDGVIRITTRKDGGS